MTTGAGYPMAAEGAAHVARASAMSLDAFEAELMAAPVEDLATIMHEWGDLHLWLDDVGYRTLDRVVRTRFLTHGRSDFEQAVRGHARELAQPRIGQLRELCAALVPGEQWKADLDAAHQQLADATDATNAAQRAWEAKVEEVRPEFQAMVDAKIAELNQQYNAAVATMEERHGAKALQVRFEDAIDAHKQRTQREFDGIVKHLRKRLGGKRVAEALADWDADKVQQAAVRAKGR